MSATKIPWATHTVSPVVGCTKCSPGCANCYAERMAWRMAHNPKLPEATRAAYDMATFGGVWSNNVAEVPGWERHFKALEKARKPRRVFVESMGDLFHPGVDEYLVDRLIGRARALPQHAFLFLTKRPERMRDHMLLLQAAIAGGAPGPWPIPNLWLGATVCNQAEADAKIPLLLATPAAVRFVSIEPCLSGVDLSRHLGYNTQKGEAGHEQRRRFVRTGEVWSLGYKHQGGDTESEGRAGGEENPSRISPSEENDKGGQASFGSSPASVSSLQREDTSWDDYQPPERHKNGQQAGKLGDSHTFREHETRFPRGAKEPIRSKKPELQTNGHPNNGNTGGLRERPDHTNEPGREIRDCVPNGIENSEGGLPRKPARENGGLYKSPNKEYQTKKCEGPIHLIIVGCESGPGRRPMDIQWARDIRDQCVEAGVPFFFKQADFGRGIVHTPELDGQVWAQFPEVPK